MHDLVELLDALSAPDEPAGDPTGPLGPVADLLEPLGPSLVLLADSRGKVLAAASPGRREAYDASGPARGEPTAVSAWLASVPRFPREEGACVFPSPAGSPGLTPFAVVFEMPDGERGALGGLVHASADVAMRLSDMDWALRACGRIAWIATLTSQREAIQLTRLQHLQAEVDTIKVSHTEVINRAIEEHQQRLEEQAHRLALEEVCRAAQSANEAKSQFLANMSHELRTPLHGILSFASFGLKKAETASREDLLQYFVKIERSGKTLLALINDLLDLAKLESGRTKYDFSPVDLRLLAATVVDELSSMSAHKGLRLVVSPSTPVRPVVGDSMKLIQVIRNLLSNAVKFSPDGGVVDIEIKPLETVVQVRVSDRGVGIPENELEAIFDKFIQSSKTRTGAGGTGLGLAITREIVLAHRGRIWAANRPGGGSTLTFEVPYDLRALASVPGPAPVDSSQRGVESHA